MKALRLLLVPALAVAVLLPSAGQARSALVIRLVSITTSTNVQDNPPAGVSAGDVYTETSRLQNAVAQFGKPKGAVVGSDRGSTTVISSQAARVQGTTRLPGGALTIRGRLEIRPNALVLPVTGGTGRFAGARGTLTVTGLPGEGRASNVYRLTLP